MASHKPAALPDAASYVEDEIKLNAPSRARMEQVAAFIRDNPYYAPATKLPPPPEALAGIELLGLPHKTSRVRARTYFDTLALQAHGHAIEIRVQPDKDGLFKQTVKIGQKGISGSKALSRVEHPHLIRSAAADLTVLPAKIQDQLCGIFNQRRARDIQLWPLMVLYSQRLRMNYRPEGSDDTMIEYAHDSYVGLTCLGFQWQRWQAELEMKKGDPRVLGREAGRLTDKFPFLKIDTTSKPTPGFEALKGPLAEKNARAFLEKKLKPGAFAVLTPP